jgi:hypothetical protein
MTARETWRRVFATRVEAEEFLRERGFSVGRMQALMPRGVMRGRWDIRKWRDLSAVDRFALHGIVATTDSGCAMVLIFGAAPAEAHVAIRQSDMVMA